MDIKKCGPSNIFLHYLNRDAQDIFGLYGGSYNSNIIVRWLRRGLNASVLLCDTENYCLLPPGFWFESEYTRLLLRESAEFFRNGYIRFSIRETDYKEFSEKKREQYFDFRNSGLKEYDSFFQKEIYEDMINLEAPNIHRCSKVGDICRDIWKTEHITLVESGMGQLADIYEATKNTQEKIYAAKLVMNVAENEHTPFVWSNVSNIIKVGAIRDDGLIFRLRNFFEKNYYEVYLREYDATILRNFYMIDRNVNFGIDESCGYIADYRWFDAFLKMINLDILDCGAADICAIKLMPAWGYLFKKYIEICNMTLFTRSFSTAVSNVVIKDRFVKELSEEIRSILNAPQRDIIGGKIPLKIDKKGIDVLIIIATVDEEKAILENDSDWKQLSGPDGYDYYVKDEELRFALVRSVSMGEVSASTMAQRFLSDLRPKYITMVGFCAGNKGNVMLGDVIVCEKIYRYGVGKQKSESEFQHEIVSYSLDSAWKQMIERFGSSWRDSITIDRPQTFEKQRIELLRFLSDKGMKAKLIEVSALEKKGLSDVKSLVTDMEERGEVKIVGESLMITDDFRNKVNGEIFKWSDETPPKLWLGCLATGAYVQQWDAIFDKLEKEYDRKTIALDMEGAAIAGVGEDAHIKCLVAKGVGDYANEKKRIDNHFIEYAVYSSYRFVVSFFKELAVREAREKEDL